VSEQGVAESYEPGDKITWYHSNHHPEIEGTVIGWKDGHLIVKSIDPQPRNTEKTVAKYRVPKNNILSHDKQGVAEGSRDDDEYGPAARDAWLQQQAYNNEYDKKPVVSAGAKITTPTEDGITMQDIRLMAGEGKLTKKTVLQAIAVIRKQRKEKGVAEEQLDELKCWPGYTRVQGVPAGAPGSCKKKTNEEQHNEKCPHCGGEMVSEELMNEKQDACYHKVKSRYKVWPSAYASGALVQCRKKGASNWGTKSESVVEGLSKRDQQDVAAIKAVIASKEAELKQPNADKEAIQQSIAHELKRLALYPQDVAEDQLDEKWSQKYKSSINCSNPKGFSQKAHCAGKQKNESAILAGLKLHESK